MIETISKQDNKTDCTYTQADLFIALVTVNSMNDLKSSKMIADIIDRHLEKEKQEGRWIERVTVTPGEAKVIGKVKEFNSGSTKNGLSNLKLVK